MNLRVIFPLLTSSWGGRKLGCAMVWLPTTQFSVERWIHQELMTLNTQGPSLEKVLYKGSVLILHSEVNIHFIKEGPLKCEPSGSIKSEFTPICVSKHNRENMINLWSYCNIKCYITSLWKFSISSINTARFLHLLIGVILVKEHIFNLLDWGSKIPQKV